MVCTGKWVGRGKKCGAHLKLVVGQRHALVGHVEHLELLLIEARGDRAKVHSLPPRLSLSLSLARARALSRSRSRSLSRSLSLSLSRSLSRSLSLSLSLSLSRALSVPVRLTKCPEHCGAG